ncbi:hypothetical protein SNEBB_008762 [Seison nebaliae]|nr:hypothetical protein SNEBB_008762 [Seison nebaliae]
MCAMNMFTILFLLLSSLLPLTTSLGHGNFGLPSTKFLEFINSTLIFEADLSAKVKFRINSNFSLDEYERESLAWDRNKKNLGNRWKYLFDPLNEDEINLKFDPHSARTLYDHLLNGKSVDIQFFNDEKSKAYEVLGQKSFSLNMDEEYELEVVGYHVGYHQLKVHFSIDETKLEEFQTIAVIRQKTLSLTIFRFVIWPMIVFAGVAIGCVIDFREVLSILRRPIYPIIGFVAQYGFMPLIALLIIYVFRIPFKYGFGLFSLGCCPGGGGSNMWTLIFDGNVGLSATMTFVSSVASLC